MIGRFCIEADHPMFEGHFPDRKVVPGVVLLDRALAMAVAAGLIAENATTGPVGAKFPRPVLPGQSVEIVGQATETMLSIEATVDGLPVMRASIARQAD